MYAPTQHEFSALLEIVGRLNQAESSRGSREDISTGLLDLMQADHLASYVWNREADAFGDCVALNIAGSHLRRYEEYFQYRDPISSGMRLRTQATPVSQVISQRQLERTEFFNDFLMAAGMHHGLDLHLFDGGRHVGDLRIWRGRGRPEFSTREVALLEMLKPHMITALRRQSELKQARTDMKCWRELWMNNPHPGFIIDGSGCEIDRNISAARLADQLGPEQSAALSALLRKLPQEESIESWNEFRIAVAKTGMLQGDLHLVQLVPGKPSPATPSAAQLSEHFGLTRREADVCALVLRGYTDKEIARALSIAFPTVRTHMTRSFSKFGVTNRSELIHRIAVAAH